MKRRGSCFQFLRIAPIFPLALILGAVAALPQASELDMSAFKQNQHITDNGRNIAEIGLNRKDVAEILSEVRISRNAILAHRVDMGEGIQNGLVVSATGPDWCGASGNCATWFFRKADGKWQPLRGDWGPDLDTLSAALAFVRPKRGGLDQLIIETAWRAGEANVEVWWFDEPKHEYLSNNNYCWDGVQSKAPRGRCK